MITNEEGLLTLAEATTVALPQETDTAPRQEETTLAWLLYTTARSQEANGSDLPNEDYVAFRYDEQRLTLVVCDGVGQSFFGQLAARFLGDRLLDWLWALPDGVAENGAKHAERLFNDLHAWTEVVSEVVDKHPLPESNKSSLLHTALERKRKHGSASVFACARIDSLPGGGGLSCLALWLGNTRLRFWDAGGKELLLAEEQSSHEQWSSAKGPINSNVVHHLSLPSLGKSNVQRITLHSDGLHAHADNLDGLTKVRLEEILQKLADDPASDDISLLDATFKNLS